MLLTTTAGGQVAQTLASAISEWAASSVLRVRTRHECPEDNLRELMWDSNPNCGITREGKKQRERTFPQKALTGSLAHTQNKGLRECQRRARQLPYRVLPPRRPRDRPATARARRQGAAAALAPEITSSTKLWRGSQLLTMSSWDSGWLTSARSVTAWDQLPRGDTQHILDYAIVSHQGNRAAGTEEVRKTHSAPGAVHLPSTQSPEMLWTWEGNRKHRPSGFVSLWSTWEPEWLSPRNFTKHRAHLGQCPCRAPWSLSSVDLGSTCHLGLW